MSRPEVTLQEKLPAHFNIGWECCDRWVEQGKGDRPAIHYEDRTLSFRELQELSNRIGNGLSSLGLREGERFLIRLTNVPEFHAAILGGLKVGLVPIPTPTLLRERELEHIMKVGEVRLVLTDDMLAEPIRGVAPKVASLRDIVCLGKPGPDEVSFHDLVEAASPFVARPTTGVDDPSFVLFTSGTTGQPKGIAHAHRAFNIAVGNPAGRWGIGLRPDDIVLQPHDLAWSYTFGCGFLFPLHAGASVVAFSERIPLEEIFARIERHRVTIFLSVPSLYRAVLALPDIENSFDLSSLRHCISAGEPLTRHSFFEWRRRVGVDILEHIGQAELSMFLANQVHQGAEPGSMGRPLPGYDVAVLDDQGNECVGKIGELAVRDDNPALFSEYLGQPDKWAENHQNGWYLTGDMATIDEDGLFWYVSRVDDLIKSRGYLISPKEVEDTMIDHPAVLETGVVGIPHPDIGHAVKAFVVLHTGHSPSEELAEDLRKYVKSRIAPFKAPKLIEFIDALPKTSTGKILRRGLRAEVDAGAGT